MTLSKHALKRMNERQIGIATVYAVVACGEVMGFDEMGNAHLELFGYRVIVSPKSQIIITVWED